MRSTTNKTDFKGELALGASFLALFFAGCDSGLDSPSEGINPRVRSAEKLVSGVLVEHGLTSNVPFVSIYETALAKVYGDAEFDFYVNREFEENRGDRLPLAFIDNWDGEFRVYNKHGDLSHHSLVPSTGPQDVCNPYFVIDYDADGSLAFTQLPAKDLPSLLSQAIISLANEGRVITAEGLDHVHANLPTRNNHLIEGQIGKGIYARINSVNDCLYVDPDGRRH